MFQVSFSQASRLNSFFLLVSVLLRLVHWFVSALHRVRFELSFCLFFLWWAMLNEVGSLPSDGLVCIFILLLLFRWGLLHKALPVVGWFQVLHSGGFLCVISHYLRLVLELVLWISRVLGSVLPLQMLRAWSLSKDQPTSNLPKRISPEMKGPLLEFQNQCTRTQWRSLTQRKLSMPAMWIGLLGLQQMTRGSVLGFGQQNSGVY